MNMPLGSILCLFELILSKELDSARNAITMVSFFAAAIIILAAMLSHSLRTRMPLSNHFLCLVPLVVGAMASCLHLLQENAGAWIAVSIETMWLSSSSIILGGTLSVILFGATAVARQIGRTRPCA